MTPQQVRKPIASPVRTFLSGLAGGGFLLILVVGLEALLGRMAFIVPASVVAMAVLTLFFVWRGTVPGFIATGATMLFRIFPLLFIPPLVGVIRLKDLVFDNGLALLLIVTLSTFIGLVVTAVLYRWLSRDLRA